MHIIRSVGGRQCGELSNLGDSRSWDSQISREMHSDLTFSTHALALVIRQLLPCRIPLTSVPLNFEGLIAKLEAADVSIWRATQQVRVDSAAFVRVISKSGDDRDPG